MTVPPSDGVVTASPTLAASTSAIRAPLNREVARPVANLGNTCYMNAVLQALAHAPELCMALDAEPHYKNCPIYQENALSRRSSPSSSPDGAGAASASNSLDREPQHFSFPTRKSKRSGKRSPSGGSSLTDNQDKFCALCELEQHMERVHTTTSASTGSDNSSKPVAPTAFVEGFIEHVAPWFKLGVQEDSHEFLRILIDAMQSSCKHARVSPSKDEQGGNPQDTPPETIPSEEGLENTDNEYPFELFRGKVQSIVTCESCKASSSTLDPIEDIGLEVAPVTASSSVPGASGNNSPIPSSLADVSEALGRFSRPEALDSGYKCEQCGKVGRATKQSQLASVPPILTLHLKRFRYGDTMAKLGDNSQSRRSGRSELSQLIDLGGKSGSAKIEGHSKFKQIFDLKPYLTKQLQDEHPKMFCRLFAVVVHAGKNSHSGHYIAYVRHVTKNEWWKMDDARVTKVSLADVMAADAYMLFYRVVDHPVAVRLKEQASKLEEAYALQQKELTQRDMRARSREKRMEEQLSESKEPTAVSATNNENKATNNKQDRSNARSRKRKAPEYTHGDDWARSKTNLPEKLSSMFKVVENSVSDFVSFKPEFFKLIMDQANKNSARVGNGPSSGICEDDVDEVKTKESKAALLDMFHKLYQQCEKRAVPLLKRPLTRSVAKEKENFGVTVTSMVDADMLL